MPVNAKQRQHVVARTSSIGDSSCMDNFSINVIERHATPRHEKFAWERVGEEVEQTVDRNDIPNADVLIIHGICDNVSLSRVNVNTWER